MRRTRPTPSPRRYRSVLPLLAIALACGAAAATAVVAEPTAAIEAIRTALAKDDLDAATDAADKALASAPSSAPAHLWAGRAYGLKAQQASILTKMSWAGKCRKAWEKAVELDPGQIEARSDLIDFYLMAPSMVGGGIEKARAQAGAIAAIDSVQGHLAGARIALHEKDDAAAEAAYRAAIAAGPGRKEGPLGLSAFLAARKRFAEARAVWAPLAARTDGPRHFAAYQLAKIALLDGQQLEQAAAAFEAYAGTTPEKEWPTVADARWRLGLVEEKRGRKDAAVAALREALRLDPQHAYAGKDLARLAP